MYYCSSCGIYLILALTLQGDGLKASGTVNAGASSVLALACSARRVPMQPSVAVGLLVDGAVGCQNGCESG